MLYSMMTLLYIHINNNANMYAQDNNYYYIQVANVEVLTHAYK